MSVYFKKGRGWRYDFMINGKRHTEAWFETKLQAKQAEAKKREEVEKAVFMAEETETPTDISFLELVNRRLDHVKAYNSDSHYHAYLFMARRWVKRWENYKCSELRPKMIQDFLLERKKVSPFVANKDLRYLRATINFGLRKKYIENNPLEELEFFPVNKKLKYVPPLEDIEKVISVADQDTQDYLRTIQETLARMGEINGLLWEDVDLARRFVVLYTRKKLGGHRTPRKVPMTDCLYEILRRRFESRDESKPWVFWHRYWSRKEGKFLVGPFDDRKKIMKTLCKKAGVRYFRFHAIRHSGASVMDDQNVPLGAIQRILGHENRKTTEIYLHSMGRTEREAMAVFEQSRKIHTQIHTH